MAAPPTSPLRLLAEAWAAAFVAAVALSAVDTLLTLVGGAPPLVAAHHLCVSAALAAWVAMPCAGTAMLLAIVARPVRRLPPWLGGALAGAAVGALAGGMALVLLRPGDMPVDPYHLGFLVPVGCVAAGVVVGLLWTRLPAGALAAALGAGALLALGGDAFVMRGLYQTLHHTAAFFALLGATLAAWRLRAAFAAPRRLAALAGVAALAHLALLPDARAERLMARQLGTLQGAWLGLVHGLADLDHDGYSPLFWGGDCDDLDADVRPGRCEVPGNGIDENCDGRDGAPMPARPAAPARAPREPRPDVYLIVVDALRYDLAGLGPRAQAAPALERLARSGLDFRTAYTSYPATYRALSSMTQSRPWRYATGPAPSVLDRLDEAGWDVQLWIRTDRLRHTRARPALSPERARGDPFQVGPHPPGKTEWTARLIDDAIAELGVAGPPRVRWLHLLDTHAPVLRGAAGAATIDRYRAEIRHVDAQLARLLDALDGSERGRRAVVLLLGDHGESFGERGGSFHGANLFDETARVPMLMRLPGVAPRAIAAAATNLDLVPTLADYLGLADDPTWMGWDWLAGDAPGPRVLGQVEAVDNWGGAGLPAMQMVHDGRHKLIVDIDDNLESLYDLDSDPGETQDLAAREPAIAGRLHRVWAAWIDLPGCRE